MLDFLRSLWLFLTCSHAEAEQSFPSPPPHAMRCKRCGCAVECGCVDCRRHREPYRDW